MAIPNSLDYEFIVYELNIKEILTKIIKKQKLTFLQ